MEVQGPTAGTQDVGTLFTHGFCSLQQSVAWRYLTAHMLPTLLLFIHLLTLPTPSYSNPIQFNPISAPGRVDTNEEWMSACDLVSFVTGRERSKNSLSTDSQLSTLNYFFSTTGRFEVSSQFARHVHVHFL
jgi:hypothetical protein